MANRKVDIVADKLLELPFANGYGIDEEETIKLYVSRETLDASEKQQIQKIAGKIPVQVQFRPDREISVPHRLVGTVTDAEQPHVSGLSAEKVFTAKNFPGCSNPPVHLLTLSLSEMETFPPEIRALEKLNVVYTNCSACDAWMLESDDSQEEMYFQIESDHRLTPIHPERFHSNCKGHGKNSTPKAAVGIALRERIQADEHERLPVCVGGEPEWIQSESWGVCPKCERMMFFVAQIRAYDLPPSASCGDQIIYCFVCSDCRTTGILMQCT